MQKIATLLQYAALLAGLALMIIVFTAAAKTISVLGPLDCLVMEQQLKKDGYDVQVLKGTRLQAGDTVIVTVNVQTRDGRRQTIVCPLGPRKGPVQIHEGK